MRRRNEDKIAVILPAAMPGDEVKVILPGLDTDPTVLQIGPNRPTVEVNRAVGLVDRAYRIMASPRAGERSDETDLKGRPHRFWGVWRDAKFAVSQWTLNENESVRPRVVIALMHSRTLVDPIHVERTSDALLRCAHFGGVNLSVEDVQRDLDWLSEHREKKRRRTLGG